MLYVGKRWFKVTIGSIMELVRLSEPKTKSGRFKSSGIRSVSG